MKQEANIISFAVLIDKKGNIVTEQKIAEISEIKNKLNPITYATLETIVRVAKAELHQVHYKIETELDAKVYQ